jgi:hypothetical protein
VRVCALELGTLRAELRKRTEEKDAAALDAERARQRASETQEDARALAAELEAARRSAASDVREVFSTEARSIASSPSPPSARGTRRGSPRRTRPRGRSEREKGEALV